MAQEHKCLTVNAIVDGSDPIRGYELLFFYYFHFFALVTKQSAAAKSGERRNLTLGFLCLPCYM